MASARNESGWTGEIDGRDACASVSANANDDADGVTDEIDS